uniref:transposase n=1 Tax=Lactobacillus delbrueckii TaxID=1584 RepID=UPI000AC834C5|nr:transposase [Lactobacillus delbrueckii]
MIVHERGCVYNFNFHLVFVTKYRKEVFDSPEKVEEMKGLLQKRADMSDIQIQEMEVMPCILYTSYAADEGIGADIAGLHIN